MDKLRKHLVLAIDGGSLYGIAAARALMMLEEYWRDQYKDPGLLLRDFFGIAVGTSTGSIITAAIMAGKSAREIHDMYLEVAGRIFRKSWRNAFPFKYFVNYQYDNRELREILERELVDPHDPHKLLIMGDLWDESNRVFRDLVITARDLERSKTMFIKPFKSEYANWSLAKAVLCSTCIPTVFPPVNDRYVDGGVGAYMNPSFMAAFEAVFVIGYHPADVTLISLGTGIEKNRFHIEKARHYSLFNGWVDIALQQMLQGNNEHQTRSTATIYGKQQEYRDKWRKLAQGMDFRRFDFEFAKEGMSSEDPGIIHEISDVYGVKMGEAILANNFPDLDFEIYRPTDDPNPAFPEI